MYDIQQKDNFVLRFEQTVKECWNNPALNDYKGPVKTFGQLAEDIEKMNLLWKAAGLVKGDKVAINAKSSAAWATVFFAAQAGGFVAVQIFNAFTPSDIMSLTNHSDSKVLYTEKAIFDKMDFASMPTILAAIDIKSGELLASRGGFADLYNNVDALFAKAHPQGLTPEAVMYDAGTLEDTCAIMYTSGSTGNPKGVMLSIRNISMNVYFLPNHLPFKRGGCTVTILPFAHIFGMTVDMIAPLCYGMHLVVLGLPPIPSNLKPALREYKPELFFSVPLVLTKLIEDTLGEFIHSKSGAAKLEDHENNPDFCNALRIILDQALGGNIKVFATGGAAIPEHFEKLLVEKLGLPFITGYGMTETAPVISVGHLGSYKLRECGEWVEEGVDLRIDSSDPETVPGEIQLKGHIVFQGYYKNPDATAAAFTEDGWFRTGDLATMDKDKSLFIVGRSKSMILSSNGQNIFPEEIEVVLNALPYVGESLIVSRDEHLVALIVPDMNLAGDMSSDELAKVMNANLAALNKKMPAYSQVSSYELHFEPFVKTPKGSIRRFMYK
ncbi:MAG: AMP-binding protein [Bacteroidales bacterium]|nr:AMP-binding protein [Bacteroidales bacterium]